MTVRSSRRSSRLPISAFVEKLRLLACLFENGLVERIGDIEGPNDAQRVDARLPRAGRGSR